MAVTYVLPKGGGGIPPSGRTLEEIRILISCGADMVALRKIAKTVIGRYNQFLRNERRARYEITEWDYTFDVSRDEDIGHVPDRSLSAVEDSDCVIAIVGRSVPAITRLEIRRVYELRQLGRPRRLMFFALKSVPPGPLADGHVELSKFVDEIKTDFEQERIYHGVETHLDFQASLMIEMLDFLLSRTGPAFGPLSSGGER
jgi:hypothetical protein